MASECSGTLVRELKSENWGRMVWECCTLWCLIVRVDLTEPSTMLAPSEGVVSFLAQNSSAPELDLLDIMPVILNINAVLGVHDDVVLCNRK